MAHIVLGVGSGAVEPVTLNSLARPAAVVCHPPFVPVGLSAMGNWIPGGPDDAKPHPIPVWTGSVGTSDSQY